MSKLYGDRWKIVGNIGSGGQGEVFRVIDENNQYHGEFALKRLRDLTRLDRFVNEVEALKRLNHLNIVKLIDHSDFRNPTFGSRHYIVMPVAHGGDAEKRLPLFVGSVENVVRVA